MDKLIFMLKQIASQQNEDDLLDLLENSVFEFTNHHNQRVWPNAVVLTIKTAPLIYAKYYKNIYKFSRTIRERIQATSSLLLDPPTINPDYDKLVLVSTNVMVVQTTWEEINILQGKLVEAIRQSSQTIDYQNIGNTSRVMMQKIAEEVFRPEIHKPQGQEIDVHNGKYKNQLHTYIKHVLKGDTNTELRKFAEAAIDFTVRAIDLMNTTTHKLDAQRHFAEACVISAISVISLIKAVREIEKV